MSNRDRLLGALKSATVGVTTIVLPVPGTFSAFATAADDARAVINYIHEYAIPADTVAAPSN